MINQTFFYFAVDLVKKNNEKKIWCQADSRVSAYMSVRDPREPVLE